MGGLYYESRFVEIETIVLFGKMSCGCGRSATLNAFPDTTVHSGVELSQCHKQSLKGLFTPIMHQVRNT